MKKTLLFKSIALSLFMLFSIGILNAQNLILNGDMEAWDDGTSPTSWTKAENITQESTIVHGGTYSAKHIGGTKDLSQTIAVNPDTEYTISIWYYVEAGDDSDARIWSYWRTDGSTLDDNAAELRGPDNSYFTSAASWQQYEVTITSPATANELYLEVRTYSGATVYWDDISVTEVSDDPVATDLFFSEYIEGSINGNNRAIEIFNGTGAEVDLSAYTVKQSHSGTGWGVDGIAYVLPLTGTLADGDVFVIANESADASVVSAADLTFAYSDDQGHKIPFFTGDDAMGLFKADNLIDAIGVEDVRPTDGWDVAGITTATYNHTLIRKSTITQGNIDWAASAGTDADDSEWVVYDNTSADKVDNIGTHTFGEEPAPTTIDVTFNVDMNGVSSFVAGTDVVYIGGDIAGGWAEPGSDATYEMTDTDSDGIYTITLTKDPAGDIAYKFFINAGWDGGEWNGSPDRSATIEETVTLDHVFGYYINNVAITETAPYYAGDDVTLTWTSAGGVDFVKTEVWSPNEANWIELSASTDSDGSEVYSIGADVQHSTDYIVKVSYVTNGDVYAVSSTFEIIAKPTIYEIQSNTSDGDLSNYDGQKVVVSGIVTAIAGSNFWIQMAPAGKDSQYPEWSGIFGYDGTVAGAVVIGDDITLEATVDEYYNATEIVSVTSHTVNSQGNIISPVAVTAALALESYESTLITILNAVVTVEANEYGEFTINDGTADYIVDDKIFEYVPVLGDILDITGVTTYSYGAFKLYPRSADDIAFSVGIDDLSTIALNIYPNPSNGKFYLQMGDAFKANAKIEVFNVVGMKVFETLATAYKTEIDLSAMKQGVYYVRVDDGQNITTQKVMKQ